jgi:AraC-like DNA-binding protein
MKPYFDTQSTCLNSQTLLLPLIEMAMQRGVNSHQVLKGSKLFHDELIKTHQLISNTQLNIAISNAIQLLPSDGLSFLLGQHWLFNQTNYSGQALLNSKNLLQMSRVLRLKQFTLCPLVFFIPYRSDSHTHFVFNWAIAVPQPKVIGFYFEMLAAKMNALCKWRFNFAHKIIVKFPFNPPEHIEQYYAHLTVQYQFNHPYFCISIPNDLLRVSQTFAAPMMHHYYLQQAHNICEPEGFIQHLSKKLIKNPRLNSDTLAQDLNISSATLKRKLKHHNTSLQALKDVLAKQHAVINIAERGYSNEQTAHILKFSDLTNFRRTFKRWTGMTPSQLRNASELNA